MRKTLLLLSCMLLVMASVLQAQVHPVTGKIVDESGSPVPFASIKVKGSNAGTYADPKGTFTINVKNGTTLVISGVGYVPQNIQATGSEVAVVLKVDVQSLNEVVVTGLGEATSRKKVPIDVARLNSKNFAQSAMLSTQQALQGQISGAQITQNNGQPNSDYLIILRGVNTLNYKAPMYLLDGVEIRNLGDVDPAIIDHIEVVKGAVGGMLYGAQGANGVIQVFTKRGNRNQRPAVNLSSKFSSDQILRTGRSLVADKHHFKTNEAGFLLNSNGDQLTPDANGYWDDPVEDLSVDASNDKPYKETTYDHLKQGYRTAATFNNSASVSGGGNNFDYNFALSRLDQQDVFSNKYNRTNITLGVTAELAKGLTLRTNTQSVFGYDDLLGGNRFNLVNSYPFIDFTHKDTTGMIVRKAKNENQMNSLSERQWHDRWAKTTKLYETFDLDYRFPKFVEIDFKYAYNQYDRSSFSMYHNQEDAIPSDLFWGPAKAGAITEDNSKYLFQNALTTLFFRTDFQQDFHLHVPIRTTTQAAYDWRAEDNHFTRAQGLVLPPFPPYNLGATSTQTVTNDLGDDVNYLYSTRTFGYLVNQTIDFGELFGISGGFRADYASTFGAAQTPAHFPRAAGYFHPSELLKIGWLSDWKLRGGYATAGTPPKPYDRQITLDQSPLGTGTTALTIPAVSANPDLRIQKSAETEIGTDISVSPFSGSWGSKFSFSATYWKRNTKDVLQLADVAPTTGSQYTKANLTDLSSRGVDLSLDVVTASKKNFTWNTALRWGFSKTHVDRISNHLTVPAGAFGLKEGEDLGIFYGQSPLHSIDQLKNDGKTAYIAEADRGNYTLVNGNVVDTRTNAVKLTAADDLKRIGKSFPDFTASLINSFTLFQSLTVSFQFDWTHGNKIYNMTRQWMYRDKIAKDYDDVVNINGKTGAFAAYYTSMYNTLQPNSWYIEDGSFIRLRDLSLSYDASHILHLRAVKHLAVTLGGRNLLTFTKYKGLDPETTTAVNSQGGSIGDVGAFRGVDYFTVPNLKSYQVGLNIGF